MTPASIEPYRPYRPTSPGPHRCRVPVALADRLVPGTAPQPAGLSAPARRVLGLVRSAQGGCTVAQAAAVVGLSPGIARVVAVELEHAGLVHVDSASDAAGGAR
ncbi:DUF742 domain-containing protein [Streptomonospora nanhaiensis]|uniref:DUF742 domain-containing protein n=1 Tax=Streptomonospora nanhaiensis TaxID=1323731 RepID=UPI001C9938AD|nr:DUF742 domain-containing protein [Streptomonospora nanhaiensis]MBX9391583.1 DUF742 domain-containing protein [Streptomonospora nanhaiensis]MBX9391857.1 DUF742 domain-containing protein [Streptomonospora nanhaiensis]